MKLLFLSFVFTLFNFKILKSQDLTFITETYNWPDQAKKFESIPDSFKNEGAVILKDNISLNFAAQNISRRIAIKILNKEGLNYFKTVCLPQNFDITRINNSIYKQGRFCELHSPFVKAYKINYFAARIIRNNVITEIPVSVSTKKVYWIAKDGERIYDFEISCSFDQLDIGDIIEYSYGAAVNGLYDTDIFYPNDFYPKLKTTINVSSIAPAAYKNLDIIHFQNIDSSQFTKKTIPRNGNTIQEYNFEFKHLNAIKYGQNCIAGKTLPHICASVYSLKKTYFNKTIQNSKYLYTPKFSWYFIPDSLIYKDKIYDKYGASIRKFVSKFPDNPTDTFKIIFFNQVIDSINSFKFISSEEMHYNKDAQYSLNSGERLLKGQLVEEYLNETYSNILFEKNLFYYDANVEDKRFGIHSTQIRAHEKYEINFIALPVKKTFKFYMPRINGVKYFPDELPFYCEGTYCALFPKNTQASKQLNGLQDIKFIKTSLSNYNENIRTENAIVKVNLDSLITHLSIKENLNGQFSTILRHYYNNESIDSTIQMNYFKKCIEKPNAANSSILKVTESKDFPFKTSYNCSIQIKATKDSIDLKNWFSFLLGKENFKQKITQDYYLDFAFTDNYNFLFEFNKAVTVTNSDAFNKSLTNDFFEISSKLIKQGDTKYLFSISTKAKQNLIPQVKTMLLINYLEQLNDLNNLILKYKY